MEYRPFETENWVHIMTFPDGVGYDMQCRGEGNQCVLTVWCAYQDDGSVQSVLYASLLDTLHQLTALKICIGKK